MTSHDFDFLELGQAIQNAREKQRKGNSGDICARRSYSMGSNSIYGYGVPAY